MAAQRGFFDLDERYAALSAAGDPLEKLGGLIDFEIFRPALDAALQRSDGSRGGRPPLDAVMMFKTLILQTLYGLWDAQAEFQILDRRSFGRFLGLDDGDNTPDETTIWRFREALVRADAIETLFARFDAHLKSLVYLAMGGQIVDASIISAPRQRMTDAERAVQFPYLGGTSRQGVPPRRRQSMPLMIERFCSGRRPRPRFTASIGSNALKTRHSASVRSPRLKPASKWQS